MQGNVKKMATYDDMLQCIEDAVEVLVAEYDSKFREELKDVFPHTDILVPVYKAMKYLYDAREYKLLVEWISSFYYQIFGAEFDFTYILVGHEIAHEPFARFFLENLEYLVDEYLEMYDDYLI